MAPLPLAIATLLHTRGHIVASSSLSGDRVVAGGLFGRGGSGTCGWPAEPCGGYHGWVCAQQFAAAAFIMRARAEGLRDFGACLSPTNAFELLQGVETLGVRMDRHIQN